MSAKKLEALGLSVREADGRLEADLELATVSIVNPLTHSLVERVTFTEVGDRLIALDPPELLGVEPVRISGIEKASELEERILNLFNESILNLERRSNELAGLGLSPSVDPETLRLTANVSAGDLVFVIAADRRGHFRIVRAAKNGQVLELPESQAFELSEFREQSALAGYLAALVGEQVAVENTAIRTNPLAERPEPVVLLREVVERFGSGALLPPKSSLEFLVELRVNGASYRFAAARVIGRTFRGLLAGASGKVWADRFELEDFPGVTALVGGVLGVPATQVEIITGPKES
jgi:hypothetical protein